MKCPKCGNEAKENPKWPGQWGCSNPNCKWLLLTDNAAGNFGIALEKAYKEKTSPACPPDPSPVFHEDAALNHVRPDLPAARAGKQGDCRPLVETFKVVLAAKPVCIRLALVILAGHES